MARCIVTGSAGFIGSHLVDLLLREGHQVIGIDDLSTGREQNHAPALANSNFRFLQGSINDLSAHEAGEQADWFFHLAGRADLVPSINNPEDYFTVNVKGTLSALQMARALGVKRFIYTASSTCYGIPDSYPTAEDCPARPEHPYAMTKLMGEELALFWDKLYDLPVISLCLFNVYGPRSRTTGAYGAVFGVFLKQKLAGKPFTIVGDGEQTRDFTFVSDIVRAFLKAAQSEVRGQRFNVGSGNTYSVKRLANLLQGEQVHIPRRPGEPDCTFADITAITQAIDWRPEVTLEEGVERMLAVVDDWKDAPLWNEATIAEATQDWFKYLGKDEQSGETSLLQN